VGDKASDIAAGEATGVRHNLLLVAAGARPGEGIARNEFGSLAAVARWLEHTFSS
jgi:hypothetical protein